MTAGARNVFLSGVKVSLILAGALSAVTFSSCCHETTLENRRDLYGPQNYYARGPYTRGVKMTKTTIVEVKETDYKAVAAPQK